MLVNTTRRFRSSAVLIMSKENHSIIRTFLSKRYQTGVTSAKEVVCFCCCADGVAQRNPTIQKFHIRFLNKGNPQIADHFVVKIYLWVYVFFNKYDNPQITYQKLVKIYLWEGSATCPTLANSRLIHMRNKSVIIFRFYHNTQVCDFVPMCLKSPSNFYRQMTH